MRADEGGTRPVVAVVGPCTSGKTLLAEALRSAGFRSHAVAQEHSYVADMWQRTVDPDVLIYLDVSYEAARQRRQISWGPDRLEEQVARLRHARTHCDLYIQTDGRTPESICQEVLAFLSEWDMLA
jgi:nicotinamide riboside kinase